MNENAQNIIVRIEPIFVGIEDAAAMLGISVTTFKDMDRTGRLGPLPIHINTIRRRLYKVYELRQWAEANCPIREKWQKVKKEKIFENI
jgi:hypothetical protein